MTQDEATSVVEQETAEPAGSHEGTGKPGKVAATAPGKAAVETNGSMLQDLEELVPSSQNLEMLMDVNLKVTVELGRTRMKIRDVLNLSSGSIVELNKQTSEPVDILVNGALVATGEVVVLDDHFAIRIGKLLSRVERLKRVV